MTQIPSLETLTSRDSDLTMMIDCTETEVATLTSRCLVTLQHHLGSRQQSREAVMRAVEQASISER